MDRSKVKITRHAMKRFMEWRKKIGCATLDEERARKELLDLFGKAKKERLSPGLMKRIIKNKFVLCDYYICGNWRFVIKDGTMLTCERNSHDAFNFNSGSMRRKRRIDSLEKRRRRWKTAK